MANPEITSAQDEQETASFISRAVSRARKIRRLKPVISVLIPGKHESDHVQLTETMASVASLVPHETVSATMPASDSSESKQSVGAEPTTSYDPAINTSRRFRNERQDALRAALAKPQVESAAESVTQDDVKQDGTLGDLQEKRAKKAAVAGNLSPETASRLLIGLRGTIADASGGATAEARDLDPNRKPLVKRGRSHLQAVEAATDEVSDATPTFVERPHVTVEEPQEVTIVETGTVTTNQPEVYVGRRRRVDVAVDSPSEADKIAVPGIHAGLHRGELGVTKDFPLDQGGRHRMNAPTQPQAVEIPDQLHNTNIPPVVTHY